MKTTILSLVCLTAGLVALAPSSVAHKPAKPAAHAPSRVQTVLTELVRGNKRFVSGKSAHPNGTPFRRMQTVQFGQHPDAVILSCADSRVPPELLFDRGLGDLFTVRVAGNVANEDEIASAEYATEHLRVPVIVVLGHSRCGAVGAVVGDAKLPGPSFPHLLGHIRAAVTNVRHNHPELKGDTLAAECVRANVYESMADLLGGSEVLKHLVSKGEVKVVGAVYDLATGKIMWLGEHPKQKSLLGNPELAHR